MRKRILILWFQLFLSTAVAATQLNSFEELIDKVRVLKARQDTDENIDVGRELQQAIWGHEESGHTEEVYGELVRYAATELYPKFRLLSPNADYFSRDLTVHVTLAFTMQPGFYDHACLICDSSAFIREFKTPVLFFDLSLKEGSTSGGVALKSGLSRVDYSVKEYYAEAIVRYLLINKDSEKPISHDYVAYYPYKMFCLQYTTQVETEVKRLHGLAGKDHEYGIYTNNCISFVAKSLWGFGIFKDEYKQTDILRYKARSNAYPSNGGLFFVPDGLVKMVGHSPEWLKELVDDQSMVKISGVPYKVAQAENHNPLRRGECYMELEDELRTNLGDAFLREINNYVPKSNKKTQMKDEERRLPTKSVRPIDLEEKLKATKPPIQETDLPENWCTIS